MEVLSYGSQRRDSRILRSLAASTISTTLQSLEALAVRYLQLTGGPARQWREVLLSHLWLSSVVTRRVLACVHRFFARLKTIDNYL